MHALSKPAGRLLSALIETAHAEATIDGRKLKKSSRADARQLCSDRTDRQFHWDWRSLELAGLIRDWPGDDRFVAIEIEREEIAQ